MKQIPLNEVKDDLSKYLRLAEDEDIIITRHGKPAGYLVGFADEDDWIDYLILRDPKFQERMQRSIADKHAGRTIKFEALKSKRNHTTTNGRKSKRPQTATTKRKITHS